MPQSTSPIAAIQNLLRRFRSDTVGQAGSPTTLFDAYLAVDWSAKSSKSPENPSASAVWVGERLTADLHAPSFSGESYFRTRQDCLDHLRNRLLEHKGAGRRVFLGFDFAYGYPAGFAEVLDLHGDAPPWRLVWNELKHRIKDNEDNSNNRFVVAGELNHLSKGKTLGPFWGCPVGEEIPGLAPKGTTFPYHSGSGLTLDRWRETERRLRGVLSTWQLFGAGAVGSQTLVGIPAVAGLRDDPKLQQMSRVWPFETGFDLEPVVPGTPFILHAEIWPGVVKGRPGGSGLIPDRAQVRAMVDWLAELDAMNELLPLFGRPEGLSDESLKKVLDEEGWIFGSGLKGLSSPRRYSKGMLD